MASISLQDLYVVVYPHTDGYSCDTESPDEVFSTREEAQTYADTLSEQIRSFPGNVKKYRVESLADRLQTIKDECRRDGERDAHNTQSN